MTRNFPACSAVPQQTELPRASSTHILPSVISNTISGEKIAFAWSAHQFRIRYLTSGGRQQRGAKWRTCTTLGFSQNVTIY